MLHENKKSWHLKLINALWEDRICIKRSIGTSPFEIVYGVQALFPISLAVLVMKLIQEQEEEPNSVQRRINQMITLEEKREHIYNESQLFQQMVKKTHDRRVKEENFQLNDYVLKWDARIEDKGKHGKFGNLWKGPYQIVDFQGNNAYLLKDTNEQITHEWPVNGRLLKHYIQ